MQFPGYDERRVLPFHERVRLERAATRALFRACARGEVSNAEQAIKGGANLRAEQDQQAGETPLHVAARHGKPEVVRTLLHHGAAPDAMSNGGDSSLHLAISSFRKNECIEDRIACVKILVEAGADKQLSTTNHCGLTPIDLAMQSESEAIISYVTDIADRRKVQIPGRNL